MDLIGPMVRRVRNAAPVPYSGNTASDIWSGLTSRNSKTSELASFGSVGTLFACVSTIAEVTAAQCWSLERVSQNASRVYGPYTPRRVQVIKHPALDLWNNPNPFYSRHEFVETWTQHLKLTGEAIAVLVTDPRVPTLPLEMWPVRPDMMTPVPSRTEFLAGWIFTGPNGERVPLSRDEVIQVKIPNPSDPYRGQSPIQSLVPDLNASRLAAEWNARFFANDATPGGLIEVDDDVGDTEFAKLRDRWYDQHRGVSAAHRVAFLTKMRWVPNAFAPKDMQFVELRKFSSDAIREVYRMHPAILGQSADVNRANAEAADYQLAAWNVDPINDRYAGALNGRLLPRYGDPVTVEFVHETAVPDDQLTDDQHMTAQASAYATLVGAGVHPDDAAATVGLPPMRTATPEPAPPLEMIPA